jgi:pyruvate dehydrogenase E2 component (dihydrolipoamide acetyltransferase)
MNVATSLAAESRRAASPYARRLAREKAIALIDVIGSGPMGRIVACDVLSYQAPVEALAQVVPAPTPAISTITFAAEVSLADLFQLARDAERVGLFIEVVDAALRAARSAFVSAEFFDEPLIALETESKQILVSQTAGLSIRAERRLRLDAMDADGDFSDEMATASLRVLQATRVAPVSLPLLPGRELRFILVVDKAAEQANAMICANSATVSETKATELLEAFVVALEQPLALMA